MAARQQIRKAQSCAADPATAVREFHRAVKQQDMALVVFFCSGAYDQEVLEREMNLRFAGTRVVGCTTAGEIGPAGYAERSLSGASFSGEAFTAVAGVLDHLQRFSFSQGQHFAQDMVRELTMPVDMATPPNSFGLMLIDGMSMREEQVARGLQHGLGKLPMFGGSAGDGLRFSTTRVFHEGRFHDDAAVLVLISTDLPFRIFKTQHFVASEERLVVTAVDAAGRTVKEIDGLPAAEEYARLVGADPHDLDPMRFAASPVMVRINGTDYVRSIQRANADGSLSFYCAIEEGLVLRVARGVNLVKNLEETLDRLRADIGQPQLLLACDCILRKLEAGQLGLKSRVERLFRECNTIGFSTYGEQIHGIHVNQTLAGVAIGARRE